MQGLLEYPVLVRHANVVAAARVTTERVLGAVAVGVAPVGGAVLDALDVQLLRGGALALGLHTTRAAHHVDAQLQAGCGGRARWVSAKDPLILYL